MQESDLAIRPYRSGDETGILSTFNRVFREVCGAGFEDRDLAFWRWSFADCPAGQRVFVAVAPDGTIAAQYACVPHRMQSPLGELTFLSTVDSMVHPDYRAGLKRPGLFVTTTRAFQAAARARGDTLTYGYPVRSAERIGKRYLDYETLGVVDYLVRPIGAERSAPDDVNVDPVRRFSDTTDIVGRVASEKACLTVRDRAFLQWRYERIPNDPYVRLEARRKGVLCGIAVLRPEHELIPGACTIADWIVPEADEGARRALLAAADSIGRARGRSVLMTVFARSSAEFTAFGAAGFALEPSAHTLERRMTIVRFDARITLDWLEHHWWFTLGDSDLV